MIRPRLGLAALALLPLLAVRAEPPTPLGFDDLFDTTKTGSRPSQLAWWQNGAGLSYVWEGALWRMDTANGKSESLLTEKDLPGGSLDSYEWAKDGVGALLVADDDLLFWKPGSAPHRLTETKAEEEGATLSPDGRQAAFAREANLYVVDVGSGSERALTTDGETGGTLNGVNSWVYWEEIWNRNPTGFWWSPGSDRLAFYHFDDTPVAEYSLSDELGQYNTVHRQRYPKAGTANPKVKIGVIALGSGKTVWLDTTGSDPEAYLVRVAWTPDGKDVAVQRLNREQTELDLLLCTATTGACRVILEERWPTWVNLGEEFQFLPDGRFLWASEREGWRHLYLYGRDGQLVRQLTSGPWAVTSVDHLDALGGSVVFTGFASGPLGASERRVYRVSFDGTLERVTTEPGWHAARVAPDGRTWVHTWSDADNPGWDRLERSTGEVVTKLPAKAPSFDPAALPQWRIFPIESADGTRYPARMLVPPNLGDGRRAPVLMYHYGGPGSQEVYDRWDTRRGLWHKWMAQRGYLVLVVDNLGSAFFGKHGEDRDHRRFGEVNLAAQLAGVEFLKTTPFADVARIGLWGWSGGGSNTLYCVLNRPGVWKAAVSGAPVTDWKLYDSIWTERYLDSPQTNADGYEKSSAVTYAGNLKDALLIIHGTGDDNVHPQNTIAIVDRFIQAGVPYEMALYPNQKHGFRGKANIHLYRRMTEFFDRQLGAGKAAE